MTPASPPHSVFSEDCLWIWVRFVFQVRGDTVELLCQTFSTDYKTNIYRLKQNVKQNSNSKNQKMYFVD